MFKGNAEVQTKAILYWFGEGQTQCGMRRGAKMSLVLNEPHKIGCSSFKSSDYLRACPRTGILILYAKQPMENHEGSALDVKSHSIKGYL
jgi:hypothetical protein